MSLSRYKSLVNCVFFTNHVRTTECEILYKYEPYYMANIIWAENMSLPYILKQKCVLSLYILNFCALSLCVFTLFVCALLLKRERACKKAKEKAEASSKIEASVSEPYSKPSKVRFFTSQSIVIRGFQHLANRLLGA